jgi:hypothetical protein
MTKNELLEVLVDYKNDIPDEGHQQADIALLKYINDPDITTAFLEIERWYHA